VTIPRYLLFDLDGTLVDSVADLTLSLNLLGEELGQSPLTIPQVRNIVGDGATRLIKRAFGEENYQRDHLLRFLKIYTDHLTDNTTPYPGILKLLSRYPSERMAVVTNKPYQLTVDLLSALDMSQYFKVVIGGDSYPQKKPDPLPVVKALEALGAYPQQAVMVGDHHTDLYSARSAGVKTCFCAYGLGHTDGLIPDYHAENSQDLLRLFPGNAA